MGNFKLKEVLNDDDDNEEQMSLHLDIAHICLVFLLADAEECRC